MARPCRAAMAASSLGVLLRLEAGVALADGGFAEAFAGLERADVFGDVVPLVHELGIGADEADEFLAGHLRLARPLLPRTGDEAHDVVVINDGGGEEDELEVDLIHGVGSSSSSPVLPCCSLSFLAVSRYWPLKPRRFSSGSTFSMVCFVFLGEVGVLVELGFEPLDFLEVLDEGGLGGIALQIRHRGGRAVEALGLHEAVQLLHGGSPVS